MKVLRADTAGFCMGVSLALKKLNKVVREKSELPIYTLGPIIHNPHVLQEYADQGVHQIKTPDDIHEGGKVVVRAHGIPVEVERQMRDSNVLITDATCPKVKKAQLLIGEQADKGGTLLLFGEKDHPEVKGLISYAAGRYYVFDSLEQLKALALDENQSYYLAAQTTQDRKGFEEIVDYLLDTFGRKTPVLETICDATRERQQEAIEIAGKAPAMVIVGGFSSGNTRRLAHVAEEQGIYCVHVENVDQLPIDELKKFDVVGLTGGASTPKKIIDAVEEKLKSL